MKGLRVFFDFHFGETYSPVDVNLWCSIIGETRNVRHGPPLSSSLSTDGEIYGRVFSVQDARGYLTLSVSVSTHFANMSGTKMEL